MASIKDALEESFLDHNAWLKYLIFAIPLYFSTVLEIEGANPAAILAVSIPTQIFLLGFMMICTYNVRKGEDHVLPSFNILKTFLTGLKGFFVLLPYYLLGGILAYITIMYIMHLVVENFSTDFMLEILSKPLNAYVIIGGLLCMLIFLFFLSFGFTAYLLYTRRFKISDAYKIKKVVRHVADVFVAYILMIILFAIVNIIIAAPITYIIWLFVGIPSNIAIYAWSVISVLNSAMCGHYLAQLDYELIPLDEEEENLF